MLSKEKYKIRPVPLHITYRGDSYKGLAIPIASGCIEGVCMTLDVTLNNEFLGEIRWDKDGWRMDSVMDQELVNAIGEEIFLWYE